MAFFFFFFGFPLVLDDPFLPLFMLYRPWTRVGLVFDILDLRPKKLEGEVMGVHHNDN